MGSLNSRIPAISESPGVFKEPMSFVIIPKTGHLKKSLTKIAQPGSRCEIRSNILHLVFVFAFVNKHDHHAKVRSNILYSLVDWADPI